MATVAKALAAMNIPVFLMAMLGAAFWYWPVARPVAPQRTYSLMFRRRTSPSAVSSQEFESMVRQISALLSGGANELVLWRSISAVNRPSAVANLADECVTRVGAGLASSVVFQAAAGKMPSRDPARTASVELAACLETAARNGVPLIEVMDRLAGHLDAAAELRALQRTAMAGPKATAVLLGWLPVLGLAAGYLIGVDPIAALTASPLGLLAVTLGVGLLIAGRLWMSALLRAAGAKR